ncbi:MAG: HK97 gp10 family phage protein [Gammaproteobacteria bacterium]|nr:HK97 gp10 family phage protein [Gammaproteobacteria bacterium]
MTFAADLRAFAVKSEKAADATVRAITFALFREVVQRTPVGNPSEWKNPPPPGYVGGRLKGNWQVSTGSPATGALTSTDKSGATTIAKIAAGVGGLGDVSYLANNLPYAHRIEYDGWSRKQAPAGMVRVSMSRINQIVARAIRQNKV